MQARTVLLAAVGLLVACGDGTDPQVPTTVVVDPPTATFEAVGETVQFEATLLDQDGNPIESADAPVWSSSRPTVVTVGSDGLATAQGEGTATIRAVISGIQGTASAEVFLPAFDCAPGDGLPVSLAVGEHVVVSDPSTFCLDFPASSVGEEYLVGVQSVNGNGTVMTEVRVEAELNLATSPAAAQAPPPPPLLAAPSQLQLQGRAPRVRGRGDELRARHAVHHAAFLDAERERLTALAPPALAPSAAAPTAAPEVLRAIVDGGMTVGQTIDLRVRKLSGEGCGVNDYAQITAELVFKGAHSFWFADVDNPADGLSNAEYQALAQDFEDKTYPTAVGYFGQPTDLDLNDRIVIVFSKAVNEDAFSEDGTFVVGFVNPCDFYTRDVFPTSNEGEFFYHIAADPTGQFGDQVDKAFVTDLATFTVAHELTHIVQFGKRLTTERPIMAAFVMEGQATLAEEVVGHAVLGKQVGQNYGFQDAFGATEDAEEEIWYGNAFIDLARYYGLDDRDVPRISEAPEECTWVVAQPADPCLGRPSWYGVTWSFLRWYSDQFGSGFPGGEKEIQSRLIAGSDVGFDNLANLVGQNFDQLLAEWAAALYVDDKVAGLDPRLTFTSWNMDDIFDGLIAEARPTPRARARAAGFTEEFTVRAPSWEWYLLQGAGPALALRVASPQLRLLPSHMQLFVVRTQ